MAKNKNKNITLLKVEAIDYREFGYDNFLSDLQGNILKGHGRDNTMHIFVKFLPTKKLKATEWISDFANKKVTSFKEQLRQRELYKRNQVSGGLFAAIYFTNDFYQYIDKDLKKFGDEAFKVGMKARKFKLGDSHESWEPGYKEELHAMILLAHDDIVELGEQARVICDGLNCPENPTEKAIAEIIEIEYGSAIRNANGDGLEHFGYVDGISQPLFLYDDVEQYKKQNVKELDFDPTASLDLVLVKDPFGKSDESFGSYFVFRKLEQHVRGFKEAEESLAEKLGIKDKEEKERVGAMIVGRFEDGTPITLSGTDKMISSGIMNNFNYDNDAQGARCPFHGHIRKTNPRRNEADKSHRMARRGITYGYRNVSTTIDQTFVQMPKSGVGLLFMSFQQNIENQFEHIQINWANNESHPHPNDNPVGVDLIIGQGEGTRVGSYPRNYDDSTDMPKVAFENFITLKGGEYFFAPSISFLKSLKIQTT